MRIFSGTERGWAPDAQLRLIDLSADLAAIIGNSPASCREPLTKWFAPDRGPDVRCVTDRRRGADQCLRQLASVRATHTSACC